MEAIARICQEEGKLVRIPLDVPSVESGRRFVEDLDGVPILSFVRGPDQALVGGAFRFCLGAGTHLLAEVIAKHRDPLQDIRAITD